MDTRDSCDCENPSSISGPGSVSYRKPPLGWGEIYHSPLDQREILQGQSQNWESSNSHKCSMRKGMWFTLPDRL